MSLFDFFFPEVAQASHLRALRDQGSRSQQRARHESRQRRYRQQELESRVEALEEDLGYVSLVMASMLEQLDANGTLKRDDIRSIIAEIDKQDGKEDGKLDVNFLKGMSR
ncbi:MAG: hypothetical protein ACPGN3_04520 [Opitutales bacterium]